MDSVTAAGQDDNGICFFIVRGLEMRDGSDKSKKSDCEKKTTYNNAVKKNLFNHNIFFSVFLTV